MMLCEGEIDEGDAGLIAALRRGDPDGVERLVERHGARAYRLAVLVTGVEDDAEEIAREVLGAAARALHAFTEEASLGTWISRAAAAAAYRKLSSRQARLYENAPDVVASLASGDESRRPPIDDWTKRTGEPVVQAALPGLMAEVIDALPVDDRIALVLHDVEEVPRVDIAELLGTDVRSVGSSVHRARLLVRSRLAGHFALPLGPRADEAADRAAPRRNATEPGTAAEAPAYPKLRSFARRATEPDKLTRQGGADDDSAGSHDRAGQGQDVFGPVLCRDLRPDGQARTLRPGAGER